MDDKVKVKFASVPQEEGMPKAVHVEKIKGGFLIETCGYGSEEKEFVKSLYKAPAVISRLLGVKGEKNPGELEDMVEYEEN